MKGFDIQAETSDNAPIIKSRNGLYEFEPEPTHILSSALKNNPMSGICFLSLINLLFQKRKSIDWWRYKHRIIALLFMGIFNSFLAFVEDCYLCYLFCFQKTRQVVKRASSDSELEESTPVFVLGHPRTGTTLLHSLLAFDEELLTRKICKRRLGAQEKSDRKPTFHCESKRENHVRLIFCGVVSKLPA